ncbi:hypothetical protein [Aquimarina sediminis]|uniref:hypothetical protein n=1 Tax=Aquimarina sediminis TaxID=2070536 RepID=UPI000CA05D76|nr:hypothetical protein [Aquimarina sediminis]
MILKKEAIESINKKLSLPYTGVEQDWDIELADSQRVNEFVFFYKNTMLSLDEKKALMSLIFASYDDFLNECGIDKNEIWTEIVLLVQSNINLFKELLNYWSLEEETSPENYFKITPLVRDIPSLPQE